MRTKLVSFFLLFSFAIHAQKKLSGRVIATDGKKPVIAASVYLSNTSIGTITNEKGEFVLDHFPSGKFNLVVVSMGFETYTQNIQSDELPPLLLIELKSRTEELQEVIVGGYDRRGWERWGNIFLENFIGTSAFASNCELKNPKVLKFHYSEKKKELHVFSDEQLLIENKALGYIVHYKLEDFRINFDDNSLIYFGYPLFSEMPATPALAKHWSSNRQEAYYGSMTHFIRSLHTGRLTQEGFEVRRIKMITDAEQQRVKAIYAAASGKAQKLNDLPNNSLKDSLYYYRELLHGEIGSDILFDSLLQRNNLIINIDPGSDAFNFPDYLEIRYAKTEPKEYLKYLPPKSILTGTQISKLVLQNNKGVKIYSNGSYYNPQDLYTLQFWAWSEKIAMMLPFDYLPEKK